MDSICLYTIVNPRTGVRDYTCQPDYAQRKSIQGYIVYADLISKKGIYYFKGRSV